MPDSEEDFTHESKQEDDSKNAPVSQPIKFGAIEILLFGAFWIILVGSFSVLSRRQRKARADRAKEERRRWLGPDLDENPEHQAYQNTLMSDPNNTDELKKALLRRAMSDVRRLMRLQSERESITQLNRAGIFGEEMMSAIKVADRELEMEILDVQAEAETFREGWSDEIIRDAVRLVRIEDELAETKRRSAVKSESKTKEADAAPIKTKSEQKVEILDEKMRKKLLDELLSGDAENLTSSSGKDKMRKRPTVKN